MFCECPLDGDPRLITHRLNLIQGHNMTAAQGIKLELLRHCCVVVGFECH